MMSALPLFTNRPLSVLVLLLAAVTLQPAVAQPADEELPVYYVTESRAAVYREPNDAQAYLYLRLREPVYVLDERGALRRIRTQEGAQGWVDASAISNVWIRVSKSKQAVFVYRGTELYKRYTADLGLNAFADKERRGGTTNPDHWRTPTGVFAVVSKNPRSQYYKAFVLNYPSSEDARRGLKDGLITESEYQAIVQAEQEFRMPPMHTALGGMIEIHGKGTGGGTNWTYGCVAIRNSDIDEIWSLVRVGTPVMIEP